MATYLTAHADHSLGRWLATLAVSFVLLALAYGQAPDPAGQLGFSPPSARSLTSSHLAPGHSSALAAAQLRQPPGMASHAQFAR